MPVNVQMPLNNASEASLRFIISRMNPNRKSFTFLFLGDSRGIDEKHYLSDKFDKVLDAVVKRTKQKRPLFILFGGDTVYSGDVAKFKKFRQKVTHTINIKKIPFFVIPGNHDHPEGKNSASLSNFRQVFGKVHFNADVPRFGFRLIPLNNSINQTIYNGGFPASSKELDFLDGQLGRQGFRTTVLAMHAPPAVGKWAFHGFKIGKQRYFNVLKKHNRLSKILVSHIHAYDTQNINNSGQPFSNAVQYVLSGGAGAPSENLPKTYHPIYKGLNFVEFTVTQQGISSPKIFKTPR